MKKRPIGVLLIAALLLFGTASSALASIMLFWPGGPLDRLWILNPQAHEAFSGMARTAGVFMIMIGGTTALAAIGLLRARAWALWLCLILFAGNAIGDVIRMFSEPAKGIVGLTIAGALIFYLARPSLRGYVHSKRIADDLRI